MGYEYTDHKTKIDRIKRNLENEQKTEVRILITIAGVIIVWTLLEIFASNVEEVGTLIYSLNH